MSNVGWKGEKGYSRSSKGGGRVAYGTAALSETKARVIFWTDISQKALTLLKLTHLVPVRHNDIRFLRYTSDKTCRNAYETKKDLWFFNVVFATSKKFLLFPYFWPCNVRSDNFQEMESMNNKIVYEAKVTYVCEHGVYFRDWSSRFEDQGWYVPWSKKCVPKGIHSSARSSASSELQSYQAVSWTYLRKYDIVLNDPAVFVVSICDILPDKVR